MNGCRKCPAFDKCTVYEYRGSQCAALRSTYGIESDPEIITIADRIREMSDEELKEFICSILQCEFCKFEGWGGCELLEWLQQPAEEDKHGA